MMRAIPGRSGVTLALGVRVGSRVGKARVGVDAALMAEWRLQLAVVGCKVAVHLSQSCVGQYVALVLYVALVDGCILL